MFFPKEIMDFLMAIEKNLSRKAIKLIKESNYSDLADFHFGLGAYIRNEFITKESAIYDYFKGIGFESKDQMSSVLIRYLYFYLKNK